MTFVGDYKTPAFNIERNIYLVTELHVSNSNVVCSAGEVKTPRDGAPC